MPYQGLPAGLLARVSGDRVRRYAQATGWSPLGLWNDALAVYEGDGARQLLVPFRPEFDDYPLRMAEAVDRLAEVERRPALEVLEDVLVPPADRMAFCTVGGAVGHLPLPAAARLLDTVRGLLLGCARGLAMPSDPLANGSDAAWLDRCLVAWAGPGEFALTVACLLGPGNEGGHRLVPVLAEALGGLAAEGSEGVSGWLSGTGAELAPARADAPEGGLTIAVRLSREAPLAGQPFERRLVLPAERLGQLRRLLAVAERPG